VKELSGIDFAGTLPAPVLVSLNESEITHGLRKDYWTCSEVKIISQTNYLWHLRGWWLWLCYFWYLKNLNGFLIKRKNKKNDMNTLILLLAGLICFWIIYKSIDFFEKI